MANIESSYDILLKVLTKKHNEISDAFDIAIRQGNEELGEELSNKSARIGAALASLDEIVNALRSA